jgi:hypothetical protein
VSHTGSGGTPGFHPGALHKPRAMAYVPDLARTFVPGAAALCKS